MWRRTLLGLLVIALVSQAGPVDGNRGGYVLLGPGEKKRLSPLTFAGRQRACVLLIGDHEASAQLAITVYDAAGHLVAQDDPQWDFCAVLWYPPRTAAYTIELVNHGPSACRCWLAIR
jgi:YD repeat-containing protein